MQEAESVFKRWAAVAAVPALPSEASGLQSAVEQLVASKAAKDCPGVWYEVHWLALQVDKALFALADAHGLAIKAGVHVPAAEFARLVGHGRQLRASTGVEEAAAALQSIVKTRALCVLREVLNRACDIRRVQRAVWIAEDPAFAPHGGAWMLVPGLHAKLQRARQHLL